uniref:Acyltransferase 3 domain-containing protein n=1 Tax=Chromera velia CCMP2878 TaxID=1169474 RepID=A0A0G4HSB2_9ALVE|eukprot:Cvel_8220.t1-p1 / transcript=Cvel_8220.t1 / gene=Cvel_8220 / organism=Chromera_velia_CCMP2878 / gene_product=O-acetyltransferase OatA, putative / transcript_product=O-acetyltransferase OatA, putative / location=Cvel_scaffold448:84120-87839(-) / protein_length=840 / sequence_SO=supercontig / SO=protein_coding / is_pseudo=false
MSNLKWNNQIQGLRGLAVLLVLLFHSDIPWFKGGFLGVDVFFVVSGYLVTLLIVRDVESGSFSLVAFYERRIRRLLPNATAVLIFTCLITYLTLSSEAAERLRSDVMAVSLLWANYHFYFSSLDYFNIIHNVLPSPLLHFWSLAVEEQFYLLHPVLLYLTLSSGSRRCAVACFTLLSVASFGAAAYSIQSGSRSLAFFSLHTRYWELGSGCLLALLSDTEEKEARPAANGRVFGKASCIGLEEGVAEGVQERRELKEGLEEEGGQGGSEDGEHADLVNQASTTGSEDEDIDTEPLSAGRQKAINWGMQVMSWVAVLMGILLPTALFSELTVFPGAAVILAVLGTLVLLRVSPSSSLGRLLAARFLTAVGDASYSLYIWHWPSIVMLISLTQSAQSGLDSVQKTVMKLIGMLAGVGLGLIAYSWVESPVRYSEVLKKRGRSLLLGVLLVGASVAVSQLGFIFPQRWGEGEKTQSGLEATVAMWKGWGNHTHSVAASSGVPLERSAFSNVSNLHPNVLPFSNNHSMETDWSLFPFGRTPTGAALLKQWHQHYVSHLSILSRDAIHDFAVAPEVLDRVAGKNSAWDAVSGETWHERLFGPCWTDLSIFPCLYGDPNGTSTAVYLGDSVAQWALPALHYASQKLHIRVESYASSQIGPWWAPRYREETVAAIDDQGAREFQEYTEREMSKVMEHLSHRSESERPDYVFLFHINNGDNFEGVEKALDLYRGVAKRQVFLFEPVNFCFAKNPTDCIGQNREHVATCTALQSVATYRSELKDFTVHAAEQMGIVPIDLLDLFCSDDRCPVIINNTLVSEDGCHPNPNFAEMYWPILAFKIATRLPES